jgi:hypothetical protein
MSRRFRARGLAIVLAVVAASAANADQITVTCTRAIAKAFADTTFRVQICENSYLRIRLPDHGPDMIFVFTPYGNGYRLSENGTDNLAANAAVTKIRSLSTNEIRALYREAESVTKIP